MTHLTDAQRYLCHVDNWRKTFKNYQYRSEYEDLRKACNDIVHLVSDLNSEHAAHQATQAELEAAREIVELVRKEGMYWPDVQAMADARLADYDATRAGQEDQ